MPAIQNIASVILGRGKRRLATGITAVNDYGAALIDGNGRDLSIYITWDHTSAAGAIIVETAPAVNYTGTWANLQTVNWSAIDNVDIVQLPAAVGAIRARVSSTITSGTAAIDIVISSDRVSH